MGNTPLPPKTLQADAGGAVGEISHILEFLRLVINIAFFTVRGTAIIFVLVKYIQKKGAKQVYCDEIILKFRANPCKTAPDVL